MDDEAAGPTPTALRTDGQAEPLAVDPNDGPQFSWSIDDPDWGGGQSAYRLRVARDSEATADPLHWDSGVVETPRSTGIGYNGPPLAPDARYRWTVTVWNDEGERSPRSEPASFVTAPRPAWDGEWITCQPGVGDSNGWRSRWRDPADGPTEWVQVDLGGVRSIAEIALFPAEPFTDTTTPDGRTITAEDTEETYRDATVAQGPVAFGFPDRYRIEVAGDPAFDDSAVLVEETESTRPEPRREPVEHDLEDATARYVRVIATSLDSYPAPDGQFRESFADVAVFALASLAVRNDSGEDLSAGRPVSASSTVETETWGRDRLTSGGRTASMTGTSPLFRTEVTLEKPVASARARFVGLGYGDLYVNGDRVGDAVLDPGWTQYDERVLYSTIDVADHLREGENALGIWLGRGWFGKSARHWQAFGSPRARLQFSIEYEDGTTTTVATDGDWRTAPSPIVENDVYDGETYDARRERPGWATAGFDDGEWAAASVATAPNGRLCPQRADPIRVVETLEPVAIHDHEDGPIVDFGQNHTGWLALDVAGGEPGDEIVIRHAEALDEDGGLRTVDLRTADATDTYVIDDRADGQVDDRADERTYEPRFTYHGYRYAQIRAYPGELTVDDVRSRVVHTDFDSAGAFDCSSEDLAAVQANSRWGLRSNAHGVPTDCPQRDERLGFTGDGHLAARALAYNFDAGRFHAKWFRDHVDAQSRHGSVPSICPYGALPAVADPSWTVSMLAIPWHVYTFEGNVELLREHYDELRRYVEFWEAESVDDLLPADHAGYGDWVALENADGRYGEPRAFFTDAYFYRSVDLLAKIADAIGNGDHAAHYRERAAAIADAFNDRYFDADAAAYVDRTQATYALPVFFDITPAECVADVVDNLAEKVTEEDDRSLRTGFLGTRPLLSVLAEHGHADLAYDVVSREAFPGWVYQVRQGATTVWERWDSDSDDHVGGRMNSLNHSPFTMVSEWFYEHLAGIDIGFDDDGCQVEIAPAFVDDLEWAEGSVETPSGPVESRWERAEDGIGLTVTVPWNVDAVVGVPVEADGTVTIDGDAVWRNGTFVGTDGDSDRNTAGRNNGRRVTLDVSPGTHSIRIE